MKTVGRRPVNSSAMFFTIFNQNLRLISIIIQFILPPESYKLKFLQIIAKPKKKSFIFGSPIEHAQLNCCGSKHIAFRENLSHMQKGAKAGVRLNLSELVQTNARKRKCLFRVIEANKFN